MSSESARPSLFVLAGPTGVGKSELALQWAAENGAEIVSADSGQVYQGFDLGTAKPSIEERQKIIHHGLDLWRPDQRGDAMMWLRVVDAAIHAAHARGRPALVVGGTGFYLKALLYGLCDTPDPNPEIRARLEAEAAALGLEALHARLVLVDPEAAQKIKPRDPVRVLRALEFYEQTGQRLSEVQKSHAFALPRYEFHMIVVNRPRESLYARTDARVLDMFRCGLESEARALFEIWGRGVPPFQLIAYRELAAYFEGTLSREELIPAIQRATRNYAKRQLTWFRKMPATWLDAEATKNLLLEIYRLWHTVPS